MILQRLLSNTIVIAVLMYASFSHADFALHPYMGDFNTSRAGGAAIANDASTLYTNPAGLSNLREPNLTAGVHLFISSTNFTNDGSTDALGTSVSGSNGGDAGSNTPIPYFYYARPITDRWSIGAGLNVPYGLSVEWDKDWVGRYQNVEASIETLNPTVGASFKLNDGWSIGAALNYYMTDAKLSQALDFGAICLGEVDLATCSSLGMLPQAADGFIEIEGDDSAATFTLGMHKRWEKTQFGLAYQAKASHTLSGTADFTTPAAAAIFNPAFMDSGASLDLTLPETISLSIYHMLKDDVRVMADVTNTRWSRIKELVVKFDNAAQPDMVFPRDWDNTYRVSMGIDYDYNNQWSLQGAIAFEESAIPDSTYDPSVPTTDAYWLNTGFVYNKNSLRVSSGLTYIIFKDREINNIGVMGDTLRGTIDPSLIVLGAQVTWYM